jgi:excisionase family DNA binding protein
MDDILTAQEVARYLKVSRTTIWRWCNEGKLPAFKLGRGWRVYRSELERVMARNAAQVETRDSNPNEPLSANRSRK